MSRQAFIESNPGRFAEITNSDFLYQHAPCGFISFLPNGGILRVNQTFAHWLNLTEEEIYQIKFTSLLSKAGGLYYEMIVHPLLNLKGFANEVNFSFIHNECNIDTLFNAVVFKDDDGTIIAINATIQDITERKKYEAELLKAKRFAEEEQRRFEFLSNSVPNLIWTALPNGEINFLNQRTLDYLKIDLKDANNFTGIYEEDRPLFAEAWAKSLQSSTKLELELRILSGDGDLQWFFLHAEPYHNEEGVLELWFGSCTNINNQKLATLEKYNSLENSLSTAYKTIDGHRERFIQIAMNQSHLIRKPLANIMGLMDLLNDTSLPADAVELLELLKLSADELDHLIKDVIHQSSDPINPLSA